MPLKNIYTIYKACLCIVLLQSCPVDEYSDVFPLLQRACLPAGSFIAHCGECGAGIPCEYMLKMLPASQTDTLYFDAMILSEP